MWLIYSARKFGKRLKNVETMHITYGCIDDELRTKIDELDSKNEY